jgi:hypothetical protein
LEGFRRLNTIKEDSDKPSQKALLSANGFSRLSERESIDRLAVFAVFQCDDGGHRIGLFGDRPFPARVFAESIAQAGAAAGVSS